MKIFTKNSLTIIVAAFLVFSLAGLINVFAATTPSLGAAASYGILSSTFVNTSASTTITGDVGFTDAGAPTQAPLGAHTYYGSGFPYSTAGTDQGSALATGLANQACTFTFADATINLSTNDGTGSTGTGLISPGVFGPGVYCTQATRAASIGIEGITLSGAGTYIFRINGALTSVDGAVVTLTGASACDVFWTPTEATTLGPNNHFFGTVIDASGIIIGDTTDWSGRALAFGGTVTTGTAVNITVPPTCSAGVTPTPAPVGSRTGTINVVKHVINDNSRTKIVADFPLFVNGVLVVSGVTNTFPAPAAAYTITETGDTNYTRTFSGDCGSNGQIGLSPGDNKFCIITNNDIGAPIIVPPVPPLIDLVKTASPLNLPVGPGSVVYSYTLRNIGTVPVSNITIVGDTCSPIVRASGDTNGDNKLDLNETWVHTCTQLLSITHMNTAVATGWANGISAVDIASATVVVGAPIIPPLIHVVKVPSVFTLPAPGGAVTYMYTVTNPGTAPLNNVSITDDKCTGLPGRVVGHPGDLNHNDLLESNESWSFTCKTNLTQTTTNTGTVQGSANGLTARDFALATVVVATPKLPATGIPPAERNFPWNIIILVGGLMLVSVLPRFLGIKNN